MSYTPRPFNPTNPYVNQVIEELNKANTNFDLLAEAFVDRNVAGGVVKDADKVDGYHASQTPSPNTIPVAKSDGKIDIGWLSLPETHIQTYQVDFTSSGTWVVPEGVSKILVIACAGGGGGSRGNIVRDDEYNHPLYYFSGVGGEAGQSTIQVLNVYSGETLTITIGHGGSGGSDYHVYGGDGGNTSIVGSVSGVLLNLVGGRGGRGVVLVKKLYGFSYIGDDNTVLYGGSSIFGRDGYGSGGRGGVPDGDGEAGKPGFVRIIYWKAS